MFQIRKAMFKKCIHLFLRYHGGRDSSHSIGCERNKKKNFNNVNWALIRDSNQNLSARVFLFVTIDAPSPTLPLIVYLFYIFFIHFPFLFTYHFNGLKPVIRKLFVNAILMQKKIVYIYYK